MNEFIEKYYSDAEFRQFIDSISDPDSDLMIEYRIRKSYQILTENLDLISEDIDYYKFMDTHITDMIEYFKAREEYEKCSKLTEIKKLFKTL